VGLEALSRGADKCHFIEMEPWVVNNVLRPNLDSCNVAEQCMVHIMKAEEYLERALAAPEYATSFDFIRWETLCSALLPQSLHSCHLCV
jgi:16S rRNA G966 N2-methylase RsmD